MAQPMPDEWQSASHLIDSKIAALKDWRGETLARLRALILAADPNIIEQVKWSKPTSPAGVPVWECEGMICTGETYKDKVKVTFAKGAKLKDRPSCSTPVLMEARPERSTCIRAITSNRQPSRRSSVMRSR